MSYQDQMNTIDSLDYCVPNEAPSLAKAIPKLDAMKAMKTKRNEDMHVSQDVDVTVHEKTSETQRRKYFLSRLLESFYTKSNAAQKTFGLIDDNAPRTVNELIARITAGKFVVPEERKDYDSFEPLRYLRWRDPAVKADQPGFDALNTKLEALKTTAEDAIWAETDPSKLPSLVQAFETATVQ